MDTRTGTDSSQLGVHLPSRPPFHLSTLFHLDTFAALPYGHAAPHHPKSGAPRSGQISIQMVTHALMEVQMVKRVAMIFGVVFILVGLLGFAYPGGMSMGVTSPGMILGLFPVNLLHNLVHILFGIWGIMAARAYASAQTFCKLGGFIYLCLALLGLVVPTTFGLIPIGGNDVFLHTVLGVLLVWVGYVSKDEAAPATA
jgi:uncharacterized protein DUF4383